VLAFDRCRYPRSGCIDCAVTQKSAACLDHPKLKWVGDLRQEDYSAASIVKMLEICRTCPVRRECLLNALESRFETFGVWGATTTVERRKVLSARGGHDVPDLYGTKADNEDAMRMHIRKRRAREAVEEFERDLPARLRRWRRKAEAREAATKGSVSRLWGAALYQGPTRRFVNVAGLRATRSWAFR
jgi:hypothetical protein